MKEKLIEILDELNIERIMVVSKSSYTRLGIDEILSEARMAGIVFDGYTPNPDYEDIVNGVSLFRQSGCQGILAIGGGSTIDVAKCIKAYVNMKPEKDFMEQDINPEDIPFIAIPTTAGSGSEVTPNAVIYRNKVKQSVADKRLKPDYVVLDGKVLETLPVYQKKCTVLDALCQAIEAWWSLKSTEESRDYSRRAIQMILPNLRMYVEEKANDDVNQMIMEGSNLAGKAIAIAGTTVPHAMSYRLTGLYGIAHGHGVALTLPKVWKHMYDHMDECTDSRGVGHVRLVFEDIAGTILERDDNNPDRAGVDVCSGNTLENSSNNDCKNSVDEILEAIELLEQILDDLVISKPVCLRYEDDLKNLVSSVPDSKCDTNPVKTTSDDIRRIYETVIEKRC